jgi:hypothetical protein
LQQPSSLLERALLETGVDVSVSAATRSAVLDALGLESKPLAVASVRGLPFRRGAILLAALVVSAVAVAIPMAQRVRVDAPPLNSTEVVGARLKPSVRPESRSAARGDAVDAEGAETSETSLARTDITRVADESAPARASGSRGAGRNALAAEIAALDAARNRLNAGEPQTALTLLDNYTREFSKPRLALEAEVLRIDALSRSGQTDAARRRAAAFVRNHPKGVLTARVRRYLEQ